MTVTAAALRAAVTVAARLGLPCDDHEVLADGANVVVWLRPSPVVAKVPASTAAIRADGAAWLRRELDVALFLQATGAPVIPPSPEVPTTVQVGDGHVMSFWTYLKPSDAGLPDDVTMGRLLRELHEAMRSYSGSDLVLAPLLDIPVFLDRPQTLLSAGDVAALSAAYGQPVDDAELDLCEQLRRLHLTVWYALYAERLPECRQRATDLVASWR